MNKIYRKVWNKALGRIVVASEFARSDSAGVTVGALGMVKGPSHATLMLAVALALVSMGASAQVADYAPDGVTIGQTELDANGLRVGAAVAIGANAINVGGVTIGGGSNEVRGLSNTTWNPSGSYTAGRAATEEQLKLVSDTANAGWTVGAGGTTTNIGPGGSVTFQGSNSNISVSQTGANNNGVVTVALSNTLNLGTTGSVTTGAATLSNSGLAVGSATVNGTGLRIAGGPSMTTTGINAGGQVVTNVGDGSLLAGSMDAVNGGQIYQLRQDLNVAGQGVKYFHARSSGDGSAARDSEANGLESVAIGPAAIADGAHSIAAGDGATTSLNGEAAIAMGRGADAQAAGSTAIGDGAAVDSPYATDAIALGTDATVTGESANAIALGTAAYASEANATALGAGARASGANSIALGQATASAGSAFAAGNGAVADSPNGIALGSGAGVGTVGTSAGDRTSHIAIGTGAGTNVVGNQTTAIGYQAGVGVVGDQNVAIGSQAGSNIAGNYNVAIGFQANLGGNVLRSVAVGSESVAGSNAAALGDTANAAVNAVAVGSGSSAGASGVALGRSASADGGHIALGSSSAAVASDYAGQGYLTGSAAVVGGSVVSLGNTSSDLQRRIVNVADGAQRYDAVNVGQLQAAQGKVATFMGGGVTVDVNGNFTPITLTDNGGQVHTFSTVSQALSVLSSGDVNFLPADAVMTDAEGRIKGITAGIDNTDVVNLGQMNQAISDNKSQYVSINSTDPTNRNNAGATGTDAIAIGPRSDAAGRQALAVGYEASADREGAVALGRDVKAIGRSSVAIGDGSYANDTRGIAIGNEALSTGANSVVIGTGAQSDPKEAGGSVDNAIVVGTEAEVSADDGISIGHSALASEERAVAQGFDAHATAIDALAEGTRARASGLRSQASGTDAQASGVDSIATGSNSRGYATNGVALGTGAIAGMDSPLPEERVNNVNAVAIGNGAMAVYRDATAVGTGAYASAESALATGTNSRATAISSVATGTGARATGQSAVATGNNAQASGESALASGTNAVAQGYASSATGLNARATAQYAVATGASAQASAIQSYAAGYDAQANAVNAMAMGSGARASHTGSVALGSGSSTADVVNTPNISVDKQTYTFAGTNAASTLSIGAVGAPRTLTNVAAGRISASSTDAVNGSQLHGTNVAVGALGDNLDTAGTSISNALGGTSTYNSGSHQVTAGLAVGGDTYTTVQGALTRAASGFKVTASGNNSTDVGVNSTTGNTMDLRSSNGNLTVTKSSLSNDVVFALNDTIDLGAAGSVITGNTVVDNTGVAVTDAATGEGARVTLDGVAVTDDEGNTTNVGATGITVGGDNPVVINGAAGTIGGLTNTSFDGDNIVSGQAATEDQLKQVSDVANMGWNVTDAEGNTANVGPDGKVTFTGDSNLTVAQTGTNDAGVVAITLNDNIDLGVTGSLVTGSTTVNTDGVSVGDGSSNTMVGAGMVAMSDGTRFTAVTSGGIALFDGTNVSQINTTSVMVGGNNPLAMDGMVGTLTGLTNKTFDPDSFTSGQAATEDQLKQVSDVANAGWNVSDSEGNTANVGPDGTVTFTGDNNLTVAQTGDDTAGVVAITLNDTIDLGTAGSVTIGNTVVDNDGVAVIDASTGEGTAVTLDGVAVTDAAGNTTNVGATSITVGGAHQVVIDGSTGTIGGLTNTTYDGNTIVSGQAATEDQLKQVSDTANAGWTVSADGSNATNVGNSSVTGNSLDLSSSNANLTVSKSTTSNDIEFALADNLDLGATGSVTTGNTVVDNTGVAVVDASTGEGTTVTLDGVAVTDAAGNTTNVGATGITVGGASPIIIDGAAGTIGGLTNTVYDGNTIVSGQAATEDQLKQVSDTANAGWTVSAEGGNATNVGNSSTTGNSMDLHGSDGNVVVSKAANSNDIAFGLADDVNVAGSVTVGNTSINNGGLTIVGGPSVTTAGIDAAGTRVTNVATGMDGDDAVNVAQLDSTIEARRTRYYSVNSTGGGNEANDGATGTDAIAAGRDAEADGDQAVAMGAGAVAAGNGSLAFGGGAQAQAVNSLAFGAGAVASHGNSIAMGAGSATTVGAQANYQGAYVGTSSSTGEMNVGGRQVTGVAAGSAATDAVNVSQLNAGVSNAISESNQYTDTQIGNVNTRIDGIDNRVTNIEGDIIDIRGDITDIRNDVVDIQGDITDLDGRMTSVEGDIREANQNAIATATKVTSIEYGADGMFQVSQDGDLDKPKATGQNSVGGGKGAVASGENSTALGNQAVASGANSTAIGQGAVASHDNSVALGQGSQTTVGAQTGYNAAYVGSSNSTGEVNIGGRTMTGVAAGVAGTDAANINQLTAGVNQAITSANQYTDSRIGKVENDLWQLDRGYRSATASAMAMAGLPQAYLPGKSMLSMAFGGYQSEYGMALGLSGITDNGRWVYKAQASGNTMRDWGFSVGAGIQW